MNENKRNGDLLPETLLTSPVGSPESRAAARAALDAMPLRFIFSTPKRENGAFRGIDPWIASGEGRQLHREKSESASDFLKRVYDTFFTVSEYWPFVEVFESEQDIPPARQP